MLHFFVIYAGGTFLLCFIFNSFWSFFNNWCFSRWQRFEKVINEMKHGWIRRLLYVRCNYFLPITIAPLFTLSTICLEIIKFSAWKKNLRNHLKLLESSLNFTSLVFIKTSENWIKWFLVYIYHMCWLPHKVGFDCFWQKSLTVKLLSDCPLIDVSSLMPTNNF